MRKYRWRFCPTVLLFLIWMLFCDRSGIGVATLLAAALHECGHLAAAKWLRIPFRALRLTPLGARLETGTGVLSYGEEFLLAAAGPLTSLLASLGAAMFWRAFGFFRLFSCASLLLGVLNLLPIRSFDGGRMLESMLSQKAGVRVACRMMQVLSFFFLLVLFSLAVYLLLRAGDGLSLLLFSVSLFFRFFDAMGGDPPCLPVIRK